MVQRPLCHSCAASARSRSAVLTVLDFDEVDVRLKNAKILGSVLPVFFFAVSCHSLKAGPHGFRLSQAEVNNDCLVAIQLF
jgi:hypothetical protein